MENFVTNGRERSHNVNKWTHDGDLEQDDHVISNDVHICPSNYQPYINLTLYNHNKNQHSRSINDTTATTFCIKRSNWVAIGVCPMLSIIFIQFLFPVQFQYCGRHTSFHWRFDESENDDRLKIYSDLGLGAIVFTSAVDGLSSDRGSDNASS